MTALGPAVSTDGGRSWSWLGRERIDGESFSCQFADDVDEVRFCLAMPYQLADLERFVAHREENPHFRPALHATSCKGRPIDRLHVGQLDGEPRYRVVLTARHHACEMMASYVLEGTIDAFLADSDDGRWLRENVELVAVPLMDVDGVEDGDQGKLRHPHDHNRDYEGDSLYPSVAANKEYIPRWSDDKLRVAIDLHCPWVRGGGDNPGSNEQIYFVGIPDQSIWQNAIELSLPVQNENGSIGLGGFNVHDLLFAGKFGVGGGLLVGDDAVFVIDVSGSTDNLFGGDPVGDQNNDASANTILDAEIATYRVLNQQLIDRGLSNESMVSIVIFSSAGTILDMDPSTPAIDFFTTPLADNNSNGMRDVDEVLMSLTAGGTTNFEDGLQKAIDVIGAAGIPAGDGNVVFLSDGFPTAGGDFSNEVNTLRNTLNMNLRAFGVGPGSSLASLQQIDPEAVQFSNTNELLNVFSGVGAAGGVGGFDTLAAFGNSAPLTGQFRWIIDKTHDGVVTLGSPDVLTIQPSLASVGFDIAGAIPVAGNFDNNPNNGDEAGLYNSGRWALDTNHNYVLEPGIDLFVQTDL